MAKRPLEECEGGEEEMEEGGEGVWGEGSKRAREDAPLMKQDHQDNDQDKVQDSAAQNTRPDMNFPLPDENGIPCLVKVSIGCEYWVSVCLRVHVFFLCHCSWIFMSCTPFTCIYTASFSPF